MNKKWIIRIIFFFFLVNATLTLAQQVFPLPAFNIGVTQATKPKQVAVTLQTLALITILTLAPAIVMMTTAFVRISVVFLFIGRALSTQQIPPRQVIMGLSLFLTFFVMSPVLKQVNDDALSPYFQKKISARQMYDKGISPVRQFMFKQTKEKDIALFIHLAKVKRPKNRSEVPTYVLIPAFMISELRTAFEIGILLFIPFVVIDLIVASVLMSMGMIMLPPIMISLPLKLILFVLVDGWHLITFSLIKSFH